MVQRRERVLPIRAAEHAACARLSAARCHGERKNHVVLIFTASRANAPLA